MSLIDNEFTDKNSVHSYLPVYNSLFKPINAFQRVLEIGVKEGGSIKMWKEYFSDTTRIHGIDITDTELKTPEVFDSRVSLHLFDAYNPVLHQQMDIHGPFDLIIDDGPHTLESMYAVIKYYLPKLNFANPHALLVIEDIQDADWLDLLIDAAAQSGLPVYPIVFDLRTIKDRYDDILLIFKAKK